MHEAHQGWGACRHGPVRVRRVQIAADPAARRRVRAASSAAGGDTSKGTVNIAIELPQQGSELAASEPIINGIKLAVKEAGGAAGGYKIEIPRLGDLRRRQGRGPRSADRRPEHGQHRDAGERGRRHRPTQLERRQGTVAFPYFGNREHDHFAGTDHPGVLVRNVPAKRIKLKNGEALVASVFDLFAANYGVDRGFGGAHVAKSYDENVPYTPAWAEKISGVPRDQIIQTAREFARNAEKTNGRSMIIIGAAMNHWFHCDMNYRGVINMLVMCGCVGQSGGGWSHYVGQEKLRPQSGWLPLAFGLDWSRPPRQQNSTSFFYAHTDQWRYETLDIGEIVSPTAPAGPWDGTLIDYNVRAERMGWLPSAPQLETNPLEVFKQAAASAKEVKDYVAGALKSGELKLSCHDPDNPINWPRNMFVWRSNLLGSSGKGHEYFLKHLLGTSHGVMGKQLGEMGDPEAKRCRLA